MGAGRVFTGLVSLGNQPASINVWKLGSGEVGWQCVAELKGHRGVVSALVPHKGQLFSGARDTTIRVWRCNS